MVTKSADAQPKEFKGVSFDVLAVGEKSMITKMNYKRGDYASIHSHPNEQSGYVISGKYSIVIGDNEELITSGDSYVIPGNIPHSVKVIQEGTIIDIFTPIRTDYL